MNAKCVVLNWATLAAGVSLIVAANSLSRQLAYCSGWTINAVGWLLVAVVVIPFCERVTERRRQR